MAVDITQILEPVKHALGPVGTSLSEAWSAVIGDRIAAWRLTNAAALQVAVNAEVSKLGLRLERSKIPERYAFAWFEEATKQDEPEIQQLFARLLARAAAGDEDAADRRHLEILTRLTPMDAKVMEWLFREAGYPPKHPSMGEYAAWKGARKDLGEAASISMEHLINLGVFERLFTLKQDGWVSEWETIEPGTRIGSFVKGLEDKLTIDSELSATERGMSLYKACAPISPPDGTA
jgi:hypothetical protein